MNSSHRTCSLFGSDDIRWLRRHNCDDNVNTGVDLQWSCMPDQLTESSRFSTELCWFFVRNYEYIR